MMPENDGPSQKVSVSLIAIDANFHFFAEFSPARPLFPMEPAQIKPANWRGL
jgi:hypothetical protein